MFLSPKIVSVDGPLLATLDDDANAAGNTGQIHCTLEFINRPSLTPRVEEPEFISLPTPTRHLVRNFHPLPTQQSQAPATSTVTRWRSFKSSSWPWSLLKATLRQSLLISIAKGHRGTKLVVSGHVRITLVATSLHHLPPPPPSMGIRLMLSKNHSNISVPCKWLKCPWPVGHCKCPCQAELCKRQSPWLRKRRRGRRCCTNTHKSPTCPIIVLDFFKTMGEEEEVPGAERPVSIEKWKAKASCCTVVNVSTKIVMSYQTFPWLVLSSLEVLPNSAQLLARLKLLFQHRQVTDVIITLPYRMAPKMRTYHQCQILLVPSSFKWKTRQLKIESGSVVVSWTWKKGMHSLGSHVMYNHVEYSFAY